MKKILFVSNTANFSKFNRPFMRWFKDNDWQVDYASPCEEEVLDCNKSYKIDIQRNPFSIKNLRAIRSLKSILKNENYSIVHCHTPMGSVVARLASKKFRQFGLKVIYTSHGFHFYKKSSIINWLLYYPIEKLLSKVTDILVTINEEDYTIAKNQFYTNKVYKIDGVGVNLDLFQPVSFEKKLELREQYGFQKDDFIILYIAEFINRKNHQMLFQLIKKLKNDNYNFKFIFCGKGKLLEYYKDASQKSGLDNLVNFTGYRKDIFNFCALSDLHIATSLQEGQGINNIEAMATGLPLLATDIRGHRDVIVNGRNGKLFPINDNDGLYKLVIELYNDLRIKNDYFFNNIYDSKKFSIDIAVNKMAEIYKTVM